MNLHRIIRAALPVVALPFFFASVGTQGGQPPAPPQAPMINASDDPLLAPFRFRSIGPASMGGRIDDLEAAPSDHSIIYVGYAVGGVWKSENNGTTWAPVFDTYSVASDWRPGDSPDQSEHRLRRHRRGEQPADVFVR